MKILIPGGSGQVGTILARHFHAQGHEVVVLSREMRSLPWKVAPWDGRTLDTWARELDDTDVVINLAGRSINCRYTPENRGAILDSRVDSVRVLGQAIAQAPARQRTWLQASTATIYAHRYDASNDEATGFIGSAEPDAPETWRFSIDVAKRWEETFNAVTAPRTRKVRLRSAMVMSPDKGGIFDTLLGLVKVGLGGTSGDGRQYVSWIHEADFLRAIDWLLAHPEVTGVVNLASPEPLPNKEFMAILREAWGMPVGLPATKWMLEVGAVLLRTETELILKSRRVVPGRLLKAGFTFEHAKWPEAAFQLCERSRGRRLQRS
jgi:uncharacterized protein (TIGR01777 family)